MMPLSLDNSPAHQALQVLFAAMPDEPYAVRVARERAACQDAASNRADRVADDTSSPGLTNPIGFAKGASSRTPQPSRNGASPPRPNARQKHNSTNDDEGDRVPKTLCPSKPTAAALREPLVQAGDFAAVYESIVQAPWDVVNYSEAFGQLLRAIDVASRKDARRFSAETLRIVLNMASYCTFRVQYALLQRLQEIDRQPCQRPLQVQSAIVEDYEEHLASMQTHLADLCQTQAATARLWELARPKRRKPRSKRLRNNDPCAEEAAGNPSSLSATPSKVEPTNPEFKDPTRCEPAGKPPSNQP
jgi:hypothetical protein